MSVDFIGFDVDCVEEAAGGAFRIRNRLGGPFLGLSDGLDEKSNSIKQTLNWKHFLNNSFICLKY